MRRMIVVGACAAVVLAGSAGVVAWTQVGGDEGRPVGTWHDAPGVARTPVSSTQQESAPGGKQPAAARATDAAAPATGAAGEPAPDTRRTVLPESATAAAAKGRQKVGELLTVNKLLGALKAPRRETFRYPGASYVKLHFSRMMMLPGDYLTVSDPAGRESYRYDATGLLDPQRADKWAMSITGDTAVLEVHRAAPLGATSLLGDLGVRVDKVARGLSRSEQRSAPAESLHAPGRTGREESVCGNDESSDAVCYRSGDPVAYTRSKSIARLLIDGTELCTGWRIGTRNRLLTNNHCFDNSNQAYDTEVWFNYQCARCGGYDVFQPTKVWGDRVLATNQTYDYTLFTVENFAAVQKFGYLTLDTARPAKGQPLYVPQHPAGEPTRIAGAKGERAGNCAVVDNAYDGYATDSDVSYFCDTEGGSSGSPVISRKTNKVAALHHFGGCPNSGVRADILYGKLKNLL
jgi:lysyl endopeptidase